MKLKTILAAILWIPLAFVYCFYGFEKLNEIQLIMCLIITIIGAVCTILTIADYILIYKKGV